MLKEYFIGAVEAGVDEAGRGCLAGSVFAAAVILPDGFYHPLLNDSKQVSAPIRDKLRVIIEATALAWAVGEVLPAEIDRLNILNASFLAMNRAIEQLNIKPSRLLIDGNRFRTQSSLEYHCLVGGDAKYLSIAAASILAKTHRDEYMVNLNSEYPQYGWANNKGYPTAEHKIAIQKYGVTPYHRLTFNGCQPELFPAP